MDIGSIGAYTSYINEQASASETEEKLSLNKDFSETSAEELMDACKQFESYFLEQVFKEMMKTVSLTDEESSNAQLVDYFKDNMVQEIAAQSTENNSLGLAQMLYEQMKVTYGL